MVPSLPIETIMLTEAWFKIVNSEAAWDTVSLKGIEHVAELKRRKWPTNWVGYDAHAHNLG